MPCGRTTEYTAEKADAICALIAEGKSVKSIGQMDDQPSEATIYRWLAANEGFCEKYARAREFQADVYAQEIIDIADDSAGDMIIDPETGAERLNSEHVQRSRLRVDARKWAASKLQPKKYGDRQTVDLNTNEARDPAAIKAELAALVADDPDILSALKADEQTD